MNANDTQTKKITGYAPVNKLNMYYEIEGKGDPIVFIPPAFGISGNHTFPELTRSHSVISVDLQGNGRTADIPERPISIEQYAEDVVALLKYLKISKADFLGESYGGNTAAMIALRHPEVVRRVVTYSATFAPPPEPLNPETVHYDHTPTSETRDIAFQREMYKKVAPDPNYWPKIYQKVTSLQWKGFSNEELASLKAPILLIQGDHDFVRLEHSVETLKHLPNAELAVIPSGSHFALLSEQERVIPIIKHFLEKSDKELPIAIANVGYHPGENR